MNKILQFLLNIVDAKHKRNIYKNLQKIFNKEINTVFDIGGHEGETVSDLLKRFKICSPSELDHILILSPFSSGSYKPAPFIFLKANVSSCSISNSFFFL